MTLDQLRRFAAARSLFPPTTLKRAVEKLSFVQADPIRAPARAQDLILRHRVKNYRAGDLEQRYVELGIEEDFFVVYGFVTRSLQALMHPRVDALHPFEGIGKVSAKERRRGELLLEFVRQRGTVHPREVDEHFAHGTVRNYWGGQSNATTHLLSAMHYRGMVRVARRERGIRVYAIHRHEPAAADRAEIHARLDALVDLAVGIYAPMPTACLRDLVRRLRYAVPQWQRELKSAFQRATERLSHAEIGGVDWYWPAGERASRAAALDSVRLLTPFDPLVWDRDRFELLWGWVYRFEAYTPPAKRKLGYYALPLLWRDRVIGWSNLAVKAGKLECDFGYIAGRPPRDPAFRRELAEEVDRVRVFLGLSTA
ncbi:MAG TPA: crosslink repair DNA glycosylase YcaQ family protein [Bryobacteraceae bacterium]|nr:crosslink repair DNA glycosylase YcaQ family protein [Bryobacteraceae bacterium]